MRIRIKENHYGIRLDDGHNSKIFRNEINNGAFYGLYILDSDNVKIVNNTVKYKEDTAILLVRSDYNELINNTASFNGLNEGDHGVIIASSSYVLVLNNTSSFNTGSVLYLNGGVDITDYNKILNNKIHNNGLYGVVIGSSNFNNISENILKGDSGGSKTAELYINGNNNSIFANYFINSQSTLAKDEGNNNKWNNSDIGNYWSSYTGEDTDDDGIGDTPYLIPGVIFGPPSYDQRPIWWDSPEIFVYSPNVNDTFESSPTFNISVSRGIINSSWYTLNNGITNITFTGLNGVIDKEEWKEKGVGSVFISFYVNDSKGYISSDIVQVFKYYDIPQISITSLIMNQVYGFNAPDFVITINDSSSNRIP